MATVLDATYGGQTANSYLTLADADALIRDYVEGAEAWERVQGQGNKQAVALLTATRLIDAAAPWHGRRYDIRQTLEFPRTFGSNSGSSLDPAAFDAALVASEYLRQQKARVRLACAIQAVHRLAEGRDISREEQYRGVTGSSRGHRFSESESYGRPHLVLCPEAFDQLAMYEGDPIMLRGGSTPDPGGVPPGRLP